MPVNAYHLDETLKRFPQNISAAEWSDGLTGGNSGVIANILMFLNEHQALDYHRFDAVVYCTNVTSQMDLEACDPGIVHMELWDTNRKQSLDVTGYHDPGRINPFCGVMTATGHNPLEDFVESPVEHYNPVNTFVLDLCDQNSWDTLWRLIRGHSGPNHASIGDALESTLEEVLSLDRAGSLTFSVSRPVIRIKGVELDLKSFSDDFEAYVRDHKENFDALPADFEYYSDSGDSVTVETYEAIEVLASCVDERFRNLSAE